MFYKMGVTLPLVCEKYLLDKKDLLAINNHSIDRNMGMHINFQVCATSLKSYN